jgi:hypothetical protein
MSLIILFEIVYCDKGNNSNGLITVNLLIILITINSGVNKKGNRKIYLMFILLL